jgi:rod shape-determining protein MreC
MFRRALDILFQLKEYVIAGALLLCSVALIALNDTRQVQAIRSVAVLTVGFLQDSFSFIPDYFALRRDNDLLRSLNLKLSDEVNRLRESRLENIRLRQLLGIKDRPEYTYVTANVVGKSLQMLRNGITIDAGSHDGITPNMAIVTESGLVGKVISVSPHYAIGQILANREVRVSAKVQRTRVDGIIRWDGGQYLNMQNVAKTLDVRPGDVVITSDYSSIFPPGIRIGIVAATNQVTGSLFQNIDVAPAVDFLRLEEVAVITQRADSGRTVLERNFAR